MNLTIRSKLFAGFGTVLLLIVLGAIFNYFSIRHVNQTQTRLLELRQPTVLAGQSLLNGINKSLAALRGYMILGEDPVKGDKLKQERASAWADIDQAFKELSQFSKNWTDPANISFSNNYGKMWKGFAVHSWK